MPGEVVGGGGAGPLTGGTIGQCRDRLLLLYALPHRVHVSGSIRLSCFPASDRSIFGNGDQ